MLPWLTDRYTDETFVAHLTELTVHLVKIRLNCHYHIEVQQGMVQRSNVTRLQLQLCGSSQYVDVVSSRLQKWVCVCLCVTYKVEEFYTALITYHIVHSLSTNPTVIKIGLTHVNEEYSGTSNNAECGSGGC